MLPKFKIGSDFEKIKAIIVGAEADVAKFDTKGNRAAGTRVRKAMQDIKGLAHGVRQTVVVK